jgi:hypothetical protein
MKEPLLLISVLSLAAPGVWAQSVPPPSSQDLNIQAYIQLLRSDVKKARSEIMGEMMQLDAPQAARFDPIYKEFEGEYAKIGDEVLALVKKYAANYGSMTGPVADQLANRLLTIEQQRVDLKKRYYARIKGALDPIIAARFLQIENQLEKLMDLQIASELPVIN